MPIDQKKTLTTPQGVAVYPRLTEPDVKFDKAGVYSLRLRIENKEDEQKLIDSLQALYDEAYTDACKKEKSKKLKKTDTPWKPETVKQSTGEQDSDGEDITEEVETGFTLFNFKMRASGKNREGKAYTRRPSLYDAKGGSLMGQVDTLKIGGGSTVKVAYTVSPFYTAALGSGITLRLQAVQVIDLVEFGERSAKAYGFGAEEGYEAGKGGNFASDASDHTASGDDEEF